LDRIIYKSSIGDIEESSYRDNLELPKGRVLMLSDITKDRLYLSLHKAFNSGVIPILYDKNITSIKRKIDNLDFDSLPKDTSIIFFTSGTTGEPIGALKSRDNIKEELRVLTELFLPYRFERVIVTVPLIHIYGFLTGVMLPRELKTDVILKEEFLPHELIELAEDKRTLCITNPVFLKVLNRLKIDKEYPNITFLSSTGKLEASIAEELNSKIGSTIYQLFGSTETGGVAYKINSDEVWKPLKGVNISSKIDNSLMVNSPFISRYILEDRLKEVETPFITTDIIEIEESGFRLLGRKSQIIKISGKRVSLLEIERLLEESRLIDDVLVKLAYSLNSHKDEQLSIKIVSRDELTLLKKEIRKILQREYKNINIKTHIEIVDEIKRNIMGKKIRREV
jgi:acyl-coenzyme A synthetase/AMP-(fatty) acid ligase